MMGAQRAKEANLKKSESRYHFVSGISALRELLDKTMSNHVKNIIFLCLFFFAKQTQRKGGCLFQVTNTKHASCCTSAYVCFAVSDCLFRLLFFGRLANVV